VGQDREQHTNFKVENMIGANGFAPILKEFFDVYLDRESLKLFSTQVEASTAIVAATDRVRMVIIVSGQALTLLN
jgi:hypothetical protein